MLGLTQIETPQIKSKKLTLLSLCCVGALKKQINKNTLHPLEIQPFVVSFTLTCSLSHTPASAVSIKRSNSTVLVLNSACKSVRKSPTGDGAPTTGNSSNDSINIGNTDATDLKHSGRVGGRRRHASRVWLVEGSLQRLTVLHDLKLDWGWKSDSTRCVTLMKQASTAETGWERCNAETRFHWIIHKRLDWFNLI